MPLLPEELFIQEIVGEKYVLQILKQEITTDMMKQKVWHSVWGQITVTSNAVEISRILMLASNYKIQLLLLVQELV
jgi:hypothetical protein